MRPAAFVLGIFKNSDCRPPARVLWRGLTKRCPRCGFRFEREEGFFLGAYVINLAVSELAVVAVVAALIVQEARGRVGSLLPWIAVSAGIQILLPLVFYPYSKTTWSALDLVMRPLDPHEEAEAVIPDRRTCGT